MLSKAKVLTLLGCLVLGVALVQGRQPALAVISSNSVVTKVGNPTDPAPNFGNSKIVDTAAHIDSLLALGPNQEGFRNADGSLQEWYNVKTDEPGVYYWCNFLVADSYSAAGFNLTRANSFGFSHLINFFQTTPGLEFLDVAQPIERIKPGAVAFFGNDDLFHVSIVYSINVDKDGDGTLGTYDSNNIETKDVITVQNHHAQSAKLTRSLYSVVGFGEPSGN